MRILIVVIISILLSFGCTKENENKLDSYFESEIVGFDLNCRTCILKFPNDSVTISQVIGQSRNNYYQTTNLLMDTFRIGQKVSVKLRKAVNDDLRACITLYPSYDYTNIFITDYKP